MRLSVREGESLLCDVIYKSIFNIVSTELVDFSWSSLSGLFFLALIIIHASWRWFLHGFGIIMLLPFARKELVQHSQIVLLQFLYQIQGSECDFLDSLSSVDLPAPVGCDVVWRVVYDAVLQQMVFHCPHWSVRCVPVLVRLFRLLEMCSLVPARSLVHLIYFHSFFRHRVCRLPFSAAIRSFFFDLLQVNFHSDRDSLNFWLFFSVPTSFE